MAMTFEALKVAISEDDKKKVSKLLKKPDICQQLGSLFGERKTTVLHEACKHGQTDIVRQLINAGADISQQGYNGWVGLHKAAAWGQPGCVEVLLQNKADVNVTTYSQSTPLHLAAEKTRVIYHQTIVKDDNYDAKILHKQYREVVRLLLLHGANVDATNYAGRTPLHNSAAGGYVDVAYLLLEHNADVNTRDNRGKTAQDVARANRHYDMVEWFLEVEVSQERLVRQDLARLAASEHDKLERRLVELVEEHDAELAEQKAQLQQAYKFDIDAHTEDIRQKLLQEMAEKEHVILQLSSLVKAERQNMDNDHLGYQKYATYLLASVTGLKEQGQGQKKVIEDLEVQLQEKSHACEDQVQRVQELSTELQTAQDQTKLLIEEHTSEVERVTTGFKQNILLLQQMVDNLNVDLSTEMGLNEEKENTLAALQNDYTEQTKRNAELQKQTETIESKGREQDQLILTLRQEKQRESESVKSQEEELSVLRTKEKEMSEQHQQAIESVRSQYEQTIKSKDSEVAELKKTMLVIKSEGDKIRSQLAACESKYEPQIQALQQTLQEKEVEMESVRTDTQKQMMSQEHVYSNKLQQVETESKQKLAALQQSLMENEKHLLVATTQLKSHTESIKSFEKTQQELQQTHSVELKQLEQRLHQQHQSQMQLYQTELLQSQESEIARVKKVLEESHQSGLRQQGEMLAQKHKQEKVQLQEGFAQKQATLQQEMFRVAGAEQAKLKEQYEARIQEIQSRNTTEIVALSKKLEMERSKSQELTTQGEDTQRRLGELQRDMEREREKWNKDVVQIKSEQKEQIAQYSLQLRLKENELSTARVLQKQTEHEKQRLESKQEELSRQSAEKVKSVQVTADTQIVQLKKEVENKEFEMSTKLSELKKQDAVIKGYVIENTKLKDEYTARSCDMEAKQEVLQQEMSELREVLSERTTDLNEMKERVQSGDRDMETMRSKYEEQLRKKQEDCVTKIEDMEQLLLEKDNELKEIQQQLNSINERSEESESKALFTQQKEFNTESESKDIFTLQKEFSAESLNGLSTEQDTTSEEGHYASEETEE